VYRESGTDLTWLSVTLAMLGKFAINASFTIIYVYGPEIYPTVIRYSTSHGLVLLAISQRIRQVERTDDSKSKGKVFPYSLPSVGPGADPGVQAVSPQVT